MSETIPWNATGYNNKQHIYNHNSYGAAQVELFSSVVSEDHFLMTASYDYGVSHAAIVQNVNISWTDFRQAIRTILYHSIFGTPLISIPVCGSSNDYDPTLQDTLCMRWYIMAATMPIFRISSDFPRRDPGALATGQSKNVATEAIEKRRRLSLYFYTVLRSGEPLMRPLFYDFYSDNATLTLDTEYMVGPAILVAQPVLPEIATMVLYLPPAAGVWYEFFGGRNYSELGMLKFNVVATDWITFIAQGNIVPLRNVSR